MVGGIGMILKNRALERPMAVAMDSGAKTLVFENIFHGHELEKRCSMIDIADQRQGDPSQYQKTAVAIAAEYVYLPVGIDQAQ